MKIRTAKDVEILDQRIKDELGIDVSKYRNEEVVENFVSILVFPQYIIKWVVRPLFFSLIAYLIGFGIFDLVHIEYLLYATIGFSLFLIPGALLGLLFLLWKMKKDIWGIADYSLDIMETAIGDIKLVNSQIDIDNKQEVHSLLFNGVIHIVTIPVLSGVISEKVPFVGWIVNKLVKKVLTLVSDQFIFDQDLLLSDPVNLDASSNMAEKESQTIKSVSLSLKKLMDLSFGVAQFPLIVVFVISCLLLGGFIYLIN